MISTQLSINSRSILTDTRWIGAHGIGRFAGEVTNRLQNVVALPAGVVPHPFHRLDVLWIVWSLLRYRPGVYFSPGFNPPIWSPVPFVFTIHDLIFLHFPEEASALMQPYFNWVVKSAAHHAYRVLTVSEFSKQEIIKWANLPEEKVVVVGNGVGAEFTPDGPVHHPGYPYLLYVGNQRPHKNLDRLLLAFAKVQLNSVRLVISGNPESSILDRIKDLNLEDRVVFTGFIPDSDLPHYYRGAIALIFPSLYEGFGLPPLEAMACGVPVITSNRSSLPEVVGDAAILVDPLDVDALAQQIERVIKDRDLQKYLAVKGIERAKLFTWERTAKLTEDILVDAMQIGLYPANRVKI
jgi:glycosyltransferase involved in cell wall biosynthesis